MLTQDFDHVVDICVSNFRSNTCQFVSSQITERDGGINFKGSDILQTFTCSQLLGLSVGMSGRPSILFLYGFVGRTADHFTCDFLTAPRPKPAFDFSQRNLAHTETLDTHIAGSLFQALFYFAFYLLSRHANRQTALQTRSRFK